MIYLLAKEAGIADSNAFDLRLPRHLLMFDILKSHYKLPCRFWKLQPVLSLMISLMLLKYPHFAGKKCVVIKFDHFISSTSFRARWRCQGLLTPVVEN